MLLFGIYFRITNCDEKKERAKLKARRRILIQSNIFLDLASTLPITEASKTGLKNSTILRLSLSTIKIRKYFENRVLNNENKFGNFPFPRFGFQNWEKEHSMAMGGFLLILTMDHDIIYASENTSLILGITQVILIFTN